MYGYGREVRESVWVRERGTGESVSVQERVHGCGTECIGTGESVSVQERVYGYGRVYVYEYRSSGKFASSSNAIL